MGQPIPTHLEGRRRTADAITSDINAAMEVAVRRDPANWFWVHNRWKTRVATPAPGRLKAEAGASTTSGHG